MACHHKFENYLQLDRLDFEPTTLIVGSFNPAWPESNTAEWFYGRTDNTFFWDVLPRIYRGPSLIDATPADWKKFCHDKQIALTDLISSIDDADPTDPEHCKSLGGFADRAIEYNFDDQVYVNVVQLLQRHPTIKQVYLTRSTTDAFWRHLWNPIAHYCNHHGIRERKLLTPTTDAAYHHEAHNDEHPHNVIPKLQDYIYKRWQQEWHY